MSEMQKVLRKIEKEKEKQQIKNNTLPGFYLVRESDRQRFFVSSTVDCAALEKVCDKVLSDSDYQYWIDYCFGLDVNRCIAWANIDQTDRFL